MRRLLIAVLLLGCSSNSPPSVVMVAPPKLAEPLRVHKVLQRVDSDGYLSAETTFAVVLTQPVVPTENALALIAGDGKRIAGLTTWLNAQLVAFYPSAPLPKGADVMLRLEVELKSIHGSVLPPGQLATGASPPIESSVRPVIAALYPMDALRFSSDVSLPAEELERLAVLTDSHGPIPFLVRAAGSSADISAKSGFRPGEKVTFDLAGGPIVKTSLGRVHVEPFTVATKTGFTLRDVGEYDDKCKASFPNNVYTRVCDADIVHLRFSSPPSLDSAKKHMHPLLPVATTGDTRGHRFELKLTVKPIKLTIDDKLEDIFGQKLSSGVNVVFMRK